MKIRRVETTDAKNLIEHAELVAKETNFLGREVGELDISVEEEEKLISRWNTSKMTNFLICEDHDKIVGSCIISGREGRQRMAHTVTLGISVNKAYWGNKIASKMIERQIDFAKENGIKKINLEVMTTNTKAIALYKKYGFEFEGVNRMALFVEGKYYDNHYMGLII